MAKAAFWTVTDVEARKRGEQTGLDTLVVHAFAPQRQLQSRKPPSPLVLDVYKRQAGSLRLPH